MSALWLGKDLTQRPLNIHTTKPDMTNALQQALANAAANAPKGEELHLENLDVIADPTQEEFVSFDRELEKATNPPPQYDPRDVAFKPKVYMVNDPEQDGLLLSHIKCVLSEFSLINLKLDSLASIVNNVALTIQNAKQSMPQEPNHKHRSLHEWDDSTLLNELVERENGLMPFYYELLKRIGSPELQSLVMSSMQGKNASMVTLAQLCSALGSMAVQPQPQSDYQSSTLAEQQMARLQQMNAEEVNQFAQQFNTVIPKAPHPNRSQAYNPYSAS